MRHLRSVSIYFLAVTFVLLSACQTQTSAGVPTVIIASPPHGSTFTAGEVVNVQSSAADSSGISRVELLVDSVLVKQDAPPNLPAPIQFTLVQAWTAAQGQHTITVRASNPAGVTGQTSITINVNPQTTSSTTAPTAVAQITTIPTLPPIVTTEPTAAVTPLPNRSPTTAATTCNFDSKYVTDVTIPDKTVVAPGQAFTKTWRVLNSGNCPWQVGTTLTFVGGAQIGASNVIAIPNVNPGETSDISVPMQAPNSPNTYAGNWRLRDPNGNLFGTNLTVVIIVPSPNSACNGTPNDFDFNASSNSINKGDTVTLSWGKVNNATGAFLSGGEFNNTGVETPGSRAVRPPTTTTYVLRAQCAPSGQTREKAVTINVTDIANRGPLNGNFSLHPEFSPSEFSFFAFAGDIDAPCQGADGCNIDHVDLYLFDPNGKRVHFRRENNPRYCAFGGGDNDNPCTFYVYSEHNNRWDDEARTPIISGEYRMYAEAFSKDGRKKTIEDFVELNPE